MICQGKSGYCNNQDIRKCQMKSSANTMHGGNVFNGKILYLCRECRKLENGQFKLVK